VKDNILKQKGSSIALLPNLLTTISLFSGFYSIVASLEGEFFRAAVAILIAAVFDGLDGRVARITNTTSHFGMEYDSLSDLVSFGVAPGLLVYLWAIQSYGRYGWLAAFLYVATTALRLARFNSRIEKTPKNMFIGLPCPAAAMVIATSLLFYNFIGFSGDKANLLILLLVYLLSYLMVSNHFYNSFKVIPQARSFYILVGMVLALIVIASEPPVTLFLLALGYMLSAPLAGVYRFLTGKSRKQQNNEQQEYDYR